MFRGLRNGRQSSTSKSSVEIQLRSVMNKKYLPLLFTVSAKWIGGSGSIPSNKPAMPQLATLLPSSADRAKDSTKQRKQSYLFHYQPGWRHTGGEAFPAAA